MKTDLLEKLGLNKHEKGVYLTLVKHGSLNVTEIERKGRLHRPAVYKGLEKLLEKELIRISIKKKTKYYQAEHPRKLKQLVEDLSEEVDTAILEIQDLFRPQGARVAVEFFEGRDGIKSIFKDIVTTLKRGDTFYRFSSSRDVKRANTYLPKNYRHIRDAKRLERLVITNKKAAVTKKPRLERFIKTIPYDLDPFSYDVTQIIYGNRVAYIDYNSETGVIIENPLIASFQKGIFTLVYKQLA